MDTAAFLDTARAWGLTHGLRIALVFILALLGMKLSKLLAPRLLARFKRDRDEEYGKRTDTLGAIITAVLDVTIVAVGLVVVLGEIGLEIGPLLAAAGVVGLAVGFGAQSLVQDVISGFFILLEDQLRVGDVVTLDTHGGLVEKVTLRTVVLRDLSGNVHYVRNGKIDVVTNLTKEYSRYVFEIGVAYREDVDAVIALMRAVDEELRADPELGPLILEPLEVLGLDDFGDSAVVIKARTKTKPIEQWRIGREFKRRLKLSFDKQGIEIPYPHLTLYFGQDKRGEAPSARVELRGVGAPTAAPAPGDESDPRPALTARLR